MKSKNIFLFLLGLVFFCSLAFSVRAEGNVVALTNPLGASTTIPILIGKVISSVLGVVGSLALIMFVYGGFIWMTASGNEQSVTKGKNIIIWATLGLVVIFSAYALVRFVIQTVGA